MPKTKLPTADEMCFIEDDLHEFEEIIKDAFSNSPVYAFAPNIIRRAFLENKHVLKRKGYRFLGAGLTRATFVNKAFPSIVFKLEYKRRYGYDNQTEFERFQGFDPEQLKYIPKIFMRTGSYKVLVVQRVKGKHMEDVGGEDYSLINFIRSKFPHIDDIHDHNVMLCTRTKKPYLVDFAA